MLQKPCRLQTDGRKDGQTDGRTINMRMKFEIEIPKQTWLMLRKPCHLQTDGRTDRQTDGRTDEVNPVYPPSNFVGRGYKNQLYSVLCMIVSRNLWQTCLFETFLGTQLLEENVKFFVRILMKVPVVLLQHGEFSLNSSQQTPHILPVRARYGVSFAGWKFWLLCTVLFTAVLYFICQIYFNMSKHVLMKTIWFMESVKGTLFSQGVQECVQYVCMTECGLTWFYLYMIARHILLNGNIHDI